MAEFHSFLWLRSACMHAQSLQSCPTLCDSMNHSLSGSSVHDILQARIVEWVAMPSSGDLPNPRDQTRVSSISCIAVRFFTAEPLRKPVTEKYSMVYICVYMCVCVCVYTTSSSFLMLMDNLYGFHVLATVIWLADFR